MITPSTEQELSQLLADTTHPLRIVGGGTRQTLGNPVDAPKQLSCAGLTGITVLEPAALTLVVRAGTPLAEVQSALEAEGQQLPFEPMDHCGLLGTNGNSTIGGIVACNISGPRRIQAGACRDSLIGVRFVDGAGTIVKNGGRVMKNVTGYDLVKLMAGSYGTLGVMTELSFKLLPKPDHSATIVLDGLDAETGVAALCRALGSSNDVNGVAYVNGQALIRVEGFEKSVTYRVNDLKSIFKGHDITTQTDPSRNGKLWASVGNVDALQDNSKSIWKFSVKPTDGPKLEARFHQANIDVQVQYDWGGGLMHVAAPNDVNLRDHMGPIQGHATLIRGQGGGVSPMPKQSNIIANIEKGLRDKFDPKGILNTGIMG